MKSTVISILVAVFLIGGAIFVAKSNNTNSDTSNGSISNKNNVAIVDGKQIITLTARGGYQPRKSIAKAGIPTIIRFETSGTFDCSSAVRIPSLNISKNLPQTGTTDIDIGIQQTKILKGSCGMGMYPFEIDFQA